jgi:hypothetical protein
MYLDSDPTKSRVAQKEQCMCQLRQERATTLVQGICLLMSHLEWLAQQNKNGEQRINCENVIRAHEKELSDILVFLNRIDEECAHSRRIMN